VVTLLLAKMADVLSRYGDLLANAVLLGVVATTAAGAGLLPGMVGVVVLFFGHAFASAFMWALQTRGLDVLLPKTGEDRTSQLSVCTAAAAVLFAATSSFVGMVAEEQSVGAALQIIAIASLCFGGGALYKLRQTGFGK
jgi:hypothetical protein